VERRRRATIDAVANGDAMPDRPPAGLRTGRFEAFSDGVFAIAITLLVLEISVPAGSEDDLLGEIGDQWTSYLAYVASFSTIGAVWVGHSAVTDYVERVDVMMVRLNLLLLMVVSFLPFPTKLLAEYASESGSARVASTFYGVTLMAAAVLLFVLWRYAVRAELVRSDVEGVEIELLTAKLTPGLGGYVAMIVLGLFLPVIAVVGYVAIAILLLSPLRRRRRAGPAS
jgi:uncharacterized membrane protein